MGAVDDLIARADAIPLRIVVMVDGALALVIALAQGAAVAISALQRRSVFDPVTTTVRTTAAIAVPVAALIIVSALFAVLRPSRARLVSSLHAVVFLIGAAALLASVLRVVIAGFAPHAQASWTAGVLTLVCGYAVYLARRAFPGEMPLRGFRKYDHIVTMALVLPVDLAFGYRVLLHVQRMMR